MLNRSRDTHSNVAMFPRGREGSTTKREVRGLGPGYSVIVYPPWRTEMGGRIGRENKSTGWVLQLRGDNLAGLTNLKRVVDESSIHSSTRSTN
jgi:hypothetical protein